MKPFIYFLQILMGLTLIASGFVKIIDPIGFSYKLNEYFSPGVFNIPLLANFSLMLSVLLATYELLIGWMLLLGMAKMFTLSNLLILISFFGTLTFYSAYFNKVTYCGCFGEVLKLRPWESFGKNVLLLFFTLCLIGGKVYIKPFFSKRFRKLSLVFFVISSLFVAYHSINHLPLVDFGPYAAGKSISDQIKSAEELGLKEPEYENMYTLKHQKDQRVLILTDKEYLRQNLWKNPYWQIQVNKTQRRKITNGYEPPIADFFLKENKIDVTRKILAEPLSLWVISATIGEIDKQGLQMIKARVPSWKELNLPTLFLSSKEPNQLIKLPWIAADATLLKTIVRSNPGIVLLKRGRIIKKWHWRDAPKKSELTKLIESKDPIKT